VPPLALSPAQALFQRHLAGDHRACRTEHLYSMTERDESYVGPIWLDGYQNGTLNLTASYAGGATNLPLHVPGRPAHRHPPSQVVTQSLR